MSICDAVANGNNEKAGSVTDLSERATPYERAQAVFHNDIPGVMSPM